MVTIFMGFYIGLGLGSGDSSIFSILFSNRWISLILYSSSIAFTSYKDIVISPIFLLLKL
jgi:hypothetical protein